MQGFWDSSTGSPYSARYGDEIEREFDPRCSRLYRNVPRDQLVVYNPSKGVSQLQLRHPRTGNIELDELTVVVSIDGACRGNGTPSARASWGVYFGPGSPYNECGVLDSTLPHTSTRAEIEALRQLLRIIQQELAWNVLLKNYYIRTDSDSLMRAMAELMEGWTADGGRNARGQPVRHYQVLKEIHDRIDDMTYGDEGGMEFKFWHVPREQNREADALANAALDGFPSYYMSRYYR
ncbi:ribonuclease H-like protein [Hypoxylon sp. FL0543]|nr:ribonuclease H-like protein [Hypoxylon sp. FL0543]